MGEWWVYGCVWIIVVDGNGDGMDGEAVNTDQPSNPWWIPELRS